MKLMAIASTNGEQLTMSSLEMVSYINSSRKPGEAEVRHADFLVKVPKVLNGGERNFSSSYQSAQNKSLPMYNFPRREATLMAMSFSYDMQAQVLDAWDAAEKALNKPNAGTTLVRDLEVMPNFMVPSEGARGWADQYDARIALTNEISVAQPKIAFHDAVVADETTYSLAEAAKIINVPPRKFNQWLRDNKYVMYDNVAYERYKNLGLMVSKYSGFIRFDGSTAPATTRITSKGITYLQKKFVGDCK